MTGGRDVMMRRHWRRWRAVCCISAAVTAMTACLGDQAAAPAQQAADRTLGLGVASPLNAIVAVGETLGVSLHTTTLTGAPVAAYDSVLYVLQNPTDTQYVQVSPTGIVTGRAPTSANAPVRLGVIAFKGRAVAADIALIQVTATALANPTLLLVANPGDSIVGAQLLNVRLRPRVVSGSTGDAVAGVALRLEFSPQDSASVLCSVPRFTTVPQTLQAAVLGRSACAQPPEFTPGIMLNFFVSYRSGTVWVHARVHAYGTLLHDSVKVTLTHQDFGFFTLAETGNPGGFSNTFNLASQTIAIAPGGVVYFFNGYNESFGTSIDVTFDQPSAATTAPDAPDTLSGNIHGLLSNGSAIRQFLTAGTYPFTWTVTDGVAPIKGTSARGTIIVQ